MKLNYFEKSLVLLVIFLISLAGISQYHINNNMNNINKKIKKLVEKSSGKNQETIPENFKKISKDNHLFENLYNTDEVILTYSYEDVPMEMNMGKDFHNDITKKLKQENLKMKVIPYQNYIDMKQEINSKNGNQNEGCTMQTSEDQEYNKFLMQTETCLKNVCIVDNKNKKFTIIARKDMNYIINAIKDYEQSQN